MPVWLVLLCAALAAHRLTRLVVEDSLTDGARTWLAARLPWRLDELVTCFWCAGFWIAGAVVWTLYALGMLRLRWTPLCWPAIASAAALFRRYEP